MNVYSVFSHTNETLITCMAQQQKLIKTMHLVYSHVYAVGKSRILLMRMN